MARVRKCGLSTIHSLDSKDWRQPSSNFSYVGIWGFWSEVGLGYFESFAALSRIAHVRGQ